MFLLLLSEHQDLPILTGVPGGRHGIMMLESPKRWSGHDRTDRMVIDLSVKSGGISSDAINLVETAPQWSVIGNLIASVSRNGHRG